MQIQGEIKYYRAILDQYRTILDQEKALIQILEIACGKVLHINNQARLLHIIEIAQAVIKNDAGGRDGVKMILKMISTGEPSTLATYRKIALVMSGFDKNGPAVRFIDQKIKESPNGENEEVIADESQMIYALIHIARGMDTT